MGGKPKNLHASCYFRKYKATDIYCTIRSKNQAIQFTRKFSLEASVERRGNLSVFKILDKIDMTIYKIFIYQTAHQISFFLLPLSKLSRCCMPFQFASCLFSPRAKVFFFLIIFRNIFGACPTFLIRRFSMFKCKREREP